MHAGSERGTIERAQVSRRISPVNPGDWTQNAAATPKQVPTDRPRVPSNSAKLAIKVLPNVLNRRSAPKKPAWVLPSLGSNFQAARRLTRASSPGRVSTNTGQA